MTRINLAIPPNRYRPRIRVNTLTYRPLTARELCDSLDFDEDGGVTRRADASQAFAFNNDLNYDTQRMACGYDPFNHIGQFVSQECIGIEPHKRRKLEQEVA